jgi:hypothetical protein
LLEVLIDGLMAQRRNYMVCVESGKNAGGAWFARHDV